MTDSDLLRELAHLTAVADEVEANKRRLWLEVTALGFRVRRECESRPFSEDIGSGQTAEAALSGAHLTLNTRAVEYAEINRESDEQWEAGQATHLRMAAE